MSDSFYEHPKMIFLTPRRSRDAVRVPGVGVLALRPPYSGELRRPEVHLPPVDVPGEHHRQGRHDGQDVLLSRRQ